MQANKGLGRGGRGVLRLAWRAVRSLKYDSVAFCDWLVHRFGQSDRPLQLAGAKNDCAFLSRIPNEG